MFGHTNLVRRNGIFYFRARVPKALACKLGRREIGRSLKTSDPLVARLRVSMLWARLPNFWHAIGSVMTKEEIDQLLREWLKEALAGDALARSDLSWAVGHEQGGESTAHAAARMYHSHAEDLMFYWRDEVCAVGDWGQAEPYLNAFLSKRGLKLDPKSDPYKLLCMGIALAQRHLHGISMERSEGRWPEPPDVALFGSPRRTDTAIPAPDTLKVAAAVSSAPNLGDAVKDFLEEKRRPGVMPEKRLMDFEAALRLLVRQLGNGKPVDQITRSHIGDLRRLLPRLPSNFTKRFGAAPLEEIMKAAEAKSLRSLAASTINQKYLSIIEQFFGWCISCGYRLDNPAERIRVDERAHSSRKDERGTFDLDNLTAIFHAPLFVGCKSPGRIYESGSHRIDDYRFWLPLLGLFTGARLNELCQLQVSDIQEIDLVPCIDISPLPGVKRVKSKAGHRKVPLHPELIRCGFPRFVERRKKEGAIRLFTELSKDRYGYYSDKASKWFLRFLPKTLGEKIVAERHLVFHSFRHTMKDALRRAKVEERIQDALIGHETDHVSATYGEGYKPPELIEELSKVTFKDLDLSHLYIRS